MLEFSEEQKKALIHARTDINAVVAVTKNMCIGLDGDLVVKHKDDMRHFRNFTLGLPVVMGRKTFESCHRPLYGRSMCVLTSQVGLTYTDAQVFNDLEELTKHLLGFRAVVVAGGSKVYELFDPVLTGVSATIHDIEIQGDSYFKGGLDGKKWLRYNPKDITAKDAKYSTIIYQHERKHYD